jgi:hypothetical protein
VFSSFFEVNVRGCRLSWSLVAYLFFKYYRLGSWLQAQLELGIWLFIHFSKSWLVAESSIGAWYLIFISIFKILVGGYKLSWSLVADVFFNFQNLGWWR